MRRLGSTLILSAILLLLAPVHADAFWRWLDELSGPGPFYGGEFEFRLVCFSAPPKDGEYEWTYMFGPPEFRPEALPPAPPKRKKSSPPTNQQQILEERSLGFGVAKTACLFKKVPLHEKRRASINLSGSYQWARNPNLVYADALYTVSICLDLEPFFRMKKAVECRRDPIECQY